ncbi:protein of unknown function (plasmid) [Methylocella tundrae]|uniref:Uncharacterized protein n=1 Tax=Methylocella tundrae TaxID=227605 RepID=A0A4U8Z6I3_METTU|nr:protein of unknown function [Methylocella tundrae]
MAKAFEDHFTHMDRSAEAGKIDDILPLANARKAASFVISLSTKLRIANRSCPFPPSSRRPAARQIYMRAELNLT